MMNISNEKIKGGRIRVNCIVNDFISYSFRK